MKNFILGLICGAVLFSSSVIYASDSIQALLWPVKLEINGKIQQLENDFVVLNYKNHAYVPVRFVAESLGLGVRYMSKDNIRYDDHVISIMSEPITDETANKIWKIQYHLNIGRDQAYVKRLIGEPTIISTDEQQVVQWRYDISTKSDYKFIDSGQGNIDFYGLEGGDLGAQLFIKWSNHRKIMQISLGYKQQSWIYQYYVRSDGASGIVLLE